MNQPSHIDVCLALMVTLAEHGTQHAVVSPGSRNTPLVLAAVAVDALQTHVVIDERAAGFVALGIARATGRPVALICTSGSALAHYLPALIEAERSGLVIVVLSADRPAELHGCRAPQTIRQLGLLDGAVRSSTALHASDADSSVRACRAIATTLMRRAMDMDAGPIHINVHLREPLWAAHHVYPTTNIMVADSNRRRNTGHAQASLDELVAALADKRVLVIAGPKLDGHDRDPERLAAWRKLLELSDWPVLADPVSGLRWAADLPVHTAYDSYLRHAEVRQRLTPDVVVHFGGMPTSKALYAWLGELDVPQHHIQQSPEPANVGHRATTLLVADETPVIEMITQRLVREPRTGSSRIDDSWSDTWRRAEATATAVICQGIPDEAALLVNALHDAAHGHTICIASSMPIRDADAFGSQYRGPLRLLANRGANGIDGLIATAAGVAIGTGGPTTLVIGDVAFTHDIGGLAAAVRLDVPLDVHVIDNAGGGIFSYLPIARLGDGFDEFFVTPPRIDIAAVAAAVGASVQSLGAKPSETRSQDQHGPRVFVARTDKAKNLNQHADITSHVQSQVLRTIGMS